MATSQRANRVKGAHYAAGLVLLALCALLYGFRAWSPPSLRPVKMIYKGLFYAAAPSPDGRQVALVENNELRIVDAAGGEPRTLLTAGEKIMQLIWSPDGERIAFVTGMPGRVSGYTPTLHIARVADGAVVLVGGGGMRAWSPDGKSIAWIRSIAGKTPNAGSPYANPNSTRSRINPRGAKATLVVSDASSGRVLSSIEILDYRFEAPIRGEPAMGKPDPARPESWRGPAHSWISPDGMQVIKSASTDPRGDIFVMSVYGHSRLEREVEIQRWAGGMEAAWYSDSEKCVCLNQIGGPGIYPKGQGLRVVRVDGNVRSGKIRPEDNGRVRQLQLLNPRRNTVIYNRDVGNGQDFSAELWVGELRGID